MVEERVEFNVIQDDFSIYELENGQILKVKTSLIDIVNSSADDDPSGKLAMQPFSAVITPSDIERYDIEYSVGEATIDNEIKELKFTETKNVVNVYETKKSLIILAMNMTKIFLTNKMNKAQNPILRYKSTTGISVIEKPFQNDASEVQTSEINENAK